MVGLGRERPPARGRVAVGTCGCCTGGWALALATSGLAGAGGPGQAGVHLTGWRRELGKLLSAAQQDDTSQVQSQQPEPSVPSRSWPERVYGPFRRQKKEKTQTIAFARDEFALSPC